MSRPSAGTRNMLGKARRPLVIGRWNFVLARNQMPHGTAIAVSPRRIPARRVCQGGRCGGGAVGIGGGIGSLFIRGCCHPRHLLQRKMSAGANGPVKGPLPRIVHVRVSLPVIILPSIVLSLLLKMLGPPQQ